MDDVVASQQNAIVKNTPNTPLTYEGGGRAALTVLRTHSGSLRATGLHLKGKCPVLTRLRRRRWVFCGRGGKRRPRAWHTVHCRGWVITCACVLTALHVRLAPQSINT